MARIRSGAVQVHGLTELNQALRALDNGAHKELGKASREVAKFVADDARANALSLGGVAAKTAPSIKAAGGATFSGVAFGGAAYPFAGGAEFGSIRFKQFQPWRGNNSDAGYFVYPAIRDDADRIETEYRDAIDDLLRRHDLI